MLFSFSVISAMGTVSKTFFTITICLLLAANIDGRHPDITISFLDNCDCCDAGSHLAVVNIEPLDEYGDSRMWFSKGLHCRGSAVGRFRQGFDQFNSWFWNVIGNPSSRPHHVSAASSTENPVSHISAQEASDKTVVTHRKPLFGCCGVTHNPILDMKNNQVCTAPITKMNHECLHCCNGNPIENSKFNDFGLNDDRFKTYQHVFIPTLQKSPPLIKDTESSRCLAFEKFLQGIGQFKPSYWKMICKFPLRQPCYSNFCSFTPPIYNEKPVLHTSKQEASDKIVLTPRRPLYGLCGVTHNPTLVMKNNQVCRTPKTNMNHECLDCCNRNPMENTQFNNFGLHDNRFQIGQHFSIPLLQKSPPLIKGTECSRCLAFEKFLQGICQFKPLYWKMMSKFPLYQPCYSYYCGKHPSSTVPLATDKPVLQVPAKETKYETVLIHSRPPCCYGGVANHPTLHMKKNQACEGPITKRNHDGFSCCKVGPTTNLLFNNLGSYTNLLKTNSISTPEQNLHLSVSKTQCGQCFPFVKFLRGIGPFKPSYWKMISKCPQRQPCGSNLCGKCQRNTQPLCTVNPVPYVLAQKASDKCGSGRPPVRVCSGGVISNPTVLMRKNKALLCKAAVLEENQKRLKCYNVDLINYLSRYSQFNQMGAYRNIFLNCVPPKDVPREKTRKSTFLGWIPIKSRNMLPQETSHLQNKLRWNCLQHVSSYSGIEPVEQQLPPVSPLQITSIPTILNHSESFIERTCNCTYFRDVLHDLVFSYPCYCSCYQMPPMERYCVSTNSPCHTIANQGKRIIREGYTVQEKNTVQDKSSTNDKVQTT